MALFSFIAGILVGVAASSVALPLWRIASAFARGRRVYLLAAGVVASFALVAATMYLTIGSRHSLQRRKAVDYFTIAYGLPDGTDVPVGAVDSINRDQRTWVADLPTPPSRVARQ